jgi:VanZ family protein
VPKYILFLVALLWTGIVSYFCLVSSNEIPQVSIPNIDKAVHVVFHSGLTFFWFLFFKKHLKTEKIFKSLMYSVLISFVFGITIEILQELVTINRSADALDVLANMIGETVAVFIVMACNKFNVLNSILKK